MRTPYSINDRSLLEDEPFASLFSERRNARLSRKEWSKDVVGEIQADESCLAAAKAWIVLAFDFEAIPAGPGKRQADSAEKKLLNLFFCHFWMLYENLEDKANEVLAKERLQFVRSKSELKKHHSSKHDQRDVGYDGGESGGEDEVLPADAAGRGDVLLLANSTPLHQVDHRDAPSCYDTAPGDGSTSIATRYKRKATEDEAPLSTYARSQSLPYPSLADESPLSSLTDSEAEPLLSKGCQMRRGTTTKAFASDRGISNPKTRSVILRSLSSRQASPATVVSEGIGINPRKGKSKSRRHAPKPAANSLVQHEAPVAPTTRYSRSFTRKKIKGAIFLSAGAIPGQEHLGDQMQVSVSNPETALDMQTQHGKIDRNLHQTYSADGHAHSCGDVSGVCFQAQMNGVEEERGGSELRPGKVVGEPSTDIIPVEQLTHTDISASIPPKRRRGRPPKSHSLTTGPPSHGKGIHAMSSDHVEQRVSSTAGYKRTTRTSARLRQQKQLSNIEVLPEVSPKRRRHNDSINLTPQLEQFCRGDEQPLSDLVGPPDTTEAVYESTAASVPGEDINHGVLPLTVNPKEFTNLQSSNLISVPLVDTIEPSSHSLGDIVKMNTRRASPIPMYAEQQITKSRGKRLPLKKRPRVDPEASRHHQIAPLVGMVLDRGIVPLPKNSPVQRQRSQPHELSSLPLAGQTFDHWSQSASKFDNIVRNSGTNAISTLTDNNKHISDWVREEQTLDEPSTSGDEDGEVAPSSHSQPLQCPANSVDAASYLPSNEMRVHKQRLHKRPPIWATSRQEVCESFDYFRSYQSGVFHANGLVKGYLLSAFAASRDIFAHEGRVIISHGGGKAASIHTTAGRSKAQAATDQLEEDKSVKALLNTCRLRRPIALLIDDKYALFPYDIAQSGCVYVVLGFYFIANAWAERQTTTNSLNEVTRYKFQFQWCENQGEPWWIQQSPSQHVESGQVLPAMSRLPVFQSITSLPPCPDVGKNRCPVCSLTSPVVYEQGWMCLKPACSAFWKKEDGISPPTNLDYCPGFLQLVDSRNITASFNDLLPPLPVKSSSNGITTTHHFCKGWYCKACGRLSSRFKWEHWECKNCGTTYKVDGKIREPCEFRSIRPPEDFYNHYIYANSGIESVRPSPYSHGRGWSNIHTYILPQSRGKIHLILGCPLGNAKADEIFRDYQSEANNGELRFRRWPMRSHKCRGALLTNYFSQNTGEPYQYVGGTANTVPFSKAPGAVVSALELIQTRIKQSLGETVTFNEVLSAAYMERQKMAFHSDAEKGLGPVVASLSLGSPALMHFRLLSKYSSARGSGMKRNAISFFLRHGDIIVMEGLEVQTYYEHTVIPYNFRIAATARQIGEANHTISGR